MAEEPDRQGEGPGTQGGMAGLSWGMEGWDMDEHLGRCGLLVMVGS